METLPANGLEALIAVAEHGSLRRAAAALHVQPPAVSYRIKALEERVGTTLFFRTTRSVRLTDAGRALLARVQPAMTEIADSLDDARAHGAGPRGTVRITLPEVAYDLAIAPRLAAFRRAYPEIEVELSFNEAFVDMVAEGFHAGVRLGDHIQQDMVAVRLTPPLRQAVFAAPAYLDAAGRPERPTDLLEHDCIRYRYIASGRIAEWRFLSEPGRPGATMTVDTTGGLVVDSTSTLLNAARRGLGLAWLFRACIEEDLAAGTLETVLDDHTLERPGHFLYFPRANTRIRAFRAFVDFMKLRAE